VREKREIIMAQQVQGYITSDGKFYKSQTEAEFHEATEEMMRVLVKNEMSEDVLDFLTSNAAEIAKFLNAWRKHHERKGDVQDKTHTDRTSIRRV
jgi:hypothetical protein